MNMKNLTALLKEKFTEMHFHDFCIETDINAEHDSIFIISEADSDIGILISENGNICFECQLMDEIQESERMVILKMLNDLNFKYSVSLALDENNAVYLKYVSVISGNEITACEQIAVMLEFFLKMIENCMHDMIYMMQ